MRKGNYCILKGIEINAGREKLKCLLSKFEILTVNKITKIEEDNYLITAYIYISPNVEEMEIEDDLDYLFYNKCMYSDPFVRKAFEDRESDCPSFFINREEALHLSRFGTMIREYQDSEDYISGEIFFSSALTSMIMRAKMVYENAKKHPHNAPVKHISAIYRKKAEQFANLLSVNFKSERKLSFYAEKLCIDKRTLFSITKAVFTKTPKEMINDHIINQSKALLKDQDVSIKQIAFELRFNCPNQFTMFFKKHEKQTPTQFREKLFE